MTNPFDLIETRLAIIEGHLLDLKHGPMKQVGIPAEVPPIFGIDICKEVTGFAKPTIYRNTSKNLMPHFKRDGKLFFKRDETYAWMTENRIKTQSESIRELDEKFIAKKKGVTK